MIKHLRIASDLHLEGFSGRDPKALIADFIPEDPRDVDSMLILAGDISSNLVQLLEFVHAVEGRFKRVVFVPGNHELYKHDLPTWNAKFVERATGLLTNTEFVDASSVNTAIIDGVRYIFGTLWADGGPTLADQAQVGFYLNDFRLITNGFHSEYGSQLKFTVKDMIATHNAQKAEIERLLSIPFEGRTVVITHHLPSRRLVSERFWPKDGSDGANGGFASNCDNMIAVHEPFLWIHGHTHDRISTSLWKTRVECNPAGYRGEYATRFNTFMRAELREDGTRRAVVVPVFIDLQTLDVE